MPNCTKVEEGSCRQGAYWLRIRHLQLGTTLTRFLLALSSLREMLSLLWLRLATDRRGAG